MNNICRLCLQKGAVMIPICPAENDDKNLRSQILDCCSIEMFEDDILPKLICSNCKAKLCLLYEFREQCRESDLRLREQYKITCYKSLNVPSQKKLQDVSVQTDLVLLPPRTKRPLPEEVIDSDTKQNISKEFICMQPDIKYFELDNNCIDHNRSDYAIARLSEKHTENNSKSTIHSVQENDKLRREELLEVGGDRKCKANEDHVKKKESFTCHTCKKVYSSKQALLRHAKIHVNSDACDQSNKRMSKRLKKLPENHDIIKCKMCDTSFKEVGKLNLHLRTHHEGSPTIKGDQYLCDICSRTFASKTGLRFHLKTHSDSKSHTCKYCNKSFAIPSYKKRHERTHTGDKHFVCHVCSAAFASANGLMYHLRTHTGESNYQCNTCGKSFTRYKYLKEHNFTHTGERPFACKLCGSAYSNSGSLFVHEKKCKSRYEHNNSDIIKNKVIVE